MRLPPRARRGTGAQSTLATCAPRNPATTPLPALFTRLAFPLPPWPLLPSSVASHAPTEEESFGAALLMSDGVSFTARTLRSTGACHQALPSCVEQ